MCEFVSWIKVNRDRKDTFLYLDDELLSEKRSRELLKGAKDNDLLGHHAVRNVWNLKENEGEGGECRDFWNTDKLPKELQSKLKDFTSFKKNFGKMFESCAQPDDLHYIIENAPEGKIEIWKGLKEFCQQVLDSRLEKRVQELLKTVKLEKLPITARYDQSINDLVKAAKLGYANPNINERNFPEKKAQSRKREAILLDVGRVTRTEEIEALIRHLRFYLGGVKDLLSFSIDHPDRQREGPIVELGSSWVDPGGDRGVACLGRWLGERCLNLRWCGLGWHGGCRFLVFCES